VNSHTAALRKLGVDDDTLAEALGIAALFNSTNALADGYQVLPDVRPAVD
jgi:alkylhydroperoxidase family enzyme